MMTHIAYLILSTDIAYRVPFGDSAGLLLLLLLPEGWGAGRWFGVWMDRGLLYTAARGGAWARSAGVGVSVCSSSSSSLLSFYFGLWTHRHINI
jgi:hypothetical protein